MALLAHQASLLVGIMKNYPGLIKEREVMNYRQLAGSTSMSVNELLDQARSLQGEEVCIWVDAKKWNKLKTQSRSVVYITGTVQFARWRTPPKLRWIATTYPRLFQLCWPQPFAQLGHFGRYPAAIKVAKVRAFENSELLYEKPNGGGKAT